MVFVFRYGQLSHKPIAATVKTLPFVRVGRSNMDSDKNKDTRCLTENDEIDKGDEDDDREQFDPPKSRESHEDVRTSSRPKVPTDKMKEYRRQLFEGDFEALARACTKQVKGIELLLSKETEISVLEREREKLEARMDDFASAHEVLYDTFKTEDERIEQNARFDKLNSRNREILLHLKETIYAVQSQRDERRSNFSSSKLSRSSRRSKRSSVSSSSLQKKAEMAAKAARLGAELKFLDAKSQTNERLRKQEDEMKKLKMLKELAATHAELEAVKRVEEETFGPTREDQSLPTESCSEDQLEKYLLSQMDSILDTPPTTSSSSQLKDEKPPKDLPPETSQAGFEPKPFNSTPRNKVLPVDQSSLADLYPRAPNSDVRADTRVTFSVLSSAPKTHTSTSEEQHQPARSSLSDFNPLPSPFVPRTMQPRGQPRKPYPDETLNAADSDISHTPVSPGENLMQRLADLLTERQDRDSLPRPEPELFTGNPLRYPNWIKSFETLIERKTKNPSERLYYIGKYTTGEAKEAISGLLALEDTEAYTIAKKILKDRFGNPFIVADAYRKKINNWPKIPPNDGQGLRKFADFLQHCNTAMNTIQYLNVLNDPDENQKMIRKLPGHVVVRWSRVVDEWLGEDEIDVDGSVPRRRMQANKSGYPPFAEFCKFVSKEARISCNPVTSLQALKADENKERGENFRARNTLRDKLNTDLRTFATFSSEGNPDVAKGGNHGVSSGKRNVCTFCKDSHELDSCVKFLKIAIPDRRKFIQSNALCWACLKWGHTSKERNGKKYCRTCSRRHPTALHGDWIVQDAPLNQEPVHRNPVVHRIEVRDPISLAKPISHSLIVPVWLHHESNTENKIMVYALLDDQSDACFVKQTTLEKLDVDGPEVYLKLSTVLAEENITSQKITGLVVRGVNEDSEISLPRTYTRDIIPAKRSQIPRPETARKWPHLKRIANHLMPYNDNLDVGLLLGINCARAIKPREIIPGSDDDPYVKRTALGWGVIGMVSPCASECEELGVNRIFSREVQHDPKKPATLLLRRTRRRYLTHFR